MGVWKLTNAKTLSQSYKLSRNCENAASANVNLNVSGFANKPAFSKRSP